MTYLMSKINGFSTDLTLLFCVFVCVRVGHVSLIVRVVGGEEGEVVVVVRQDGE